MAGGVDDGGSGAFQSILWTSVPPSAPSEGAEVEPDCFHDLGLDQVVGHVTAGWEAYDLVPFYRAPLRETDAVAYRQEVMRDLEDRDCMEIIRSFAGAMRRMREHVAMASKLGHERQRQRWLLRAAEAYRHGVEGLQQGLVRCNPKSRGLRSLNRFLIDYVESIDFRQLCASADDAIAQLGKVHYCLQLKGRAITVRRYDSEADYSAAVGETFSRFRQRPARDYLAHFRQYFPLNQVEERILDEVAGLFPEAFAALEAFGATHGEFVDPTIARFDREVHFYVAYLSYLERYRKAELPFCYPDLSPESKAIACREAFDLALAHRLLDEGAKVVRNDFFLKGPERIFVVSGPNQGGKTTFARMFGQLHTLAALGCPVPGTEARLFLVRGIFTHFERQDPIADLRGRLQDDLVRMRAIFDRATPESAVILNEIFSSTTLEDMLTLSRKVMARLSERDVLGVWVTFLAEIASFNEKTVSLVGSLDPSDPFVATYKLERRAAGESAYALRIAEKYRVTYPQLKERFQACKPS